MKVSGLLLLLVASTCWAMEVRPAVQLGIGGNPGTTRGAPAYVVVDPHVDLQFDQIFPSPVLAFFVASQVGVMVALDGERWIFPALQVGVRFHLTDRITVGLGLGGGLAMVLAGTALRTMPTVEASLEPFTFTFAEHHQIGFSITGLFLPPLPPEEGPSGPFTSIFWPTIHYAFRF
jgi:hypothetical protein